jgi:hypothetical protein
MCCVKKSYRKGSQQVGKKREISGKLARKTPVASDNTKLYKQLMWCEKK